ncbi:MAG: hypothetical protein E6J34_08560 [Chloroflexi bacterium]|nr:MAG: hypothetical protein E6J34_08560 [Chloroflexota bacterium]
MANHMGQQFGNYRLLHQIGKGGFGQVYLGQHIYLKTQAAIKLLLEDMDNAQKEVYHAAFLQEARNIARLKHPHILRVLEFGVEMSTPYLVMEYAAHRSLLERHPRGSKVSLDRVVGYTKEIAEALQYAHEAYLIHRDVKPANVLLDERDTLLLSDFGIATVAHRTSSMRTSASMGTAAYMAPEQLQGKPVPASDQYALAVIVYEWLCGLLPYQGDPISIGMQHLMAPIPSLCVHNDALSPSIEVVVHQAMAKDPKERYATVQAFAIALEQASQDMLPTDQLRPRGPSAPLYIPSSPLSNSSGLYANTTAIDSSRPLQPAESLLRTASDSSVSRSTTHILGPQGTVPTMPNPSEKTTNKSTVSRRTILAGIASGAALVIVGGSAFFYWQQSLQNQVVKPSPVVTPPISTETPQTPTAPSNNAVLTYQGHTDTVTAVAWSPPDGQFIASCGYDKSVLVWNGSSGRTLFTYTGHSDTVWEVTWSPDGKRIASCSDDKTVQVYNASDGSNPFTYIGHTDTVGTVDWSPNGKLIASGSRDKTVRVWNASNRSNILIYKGHTSDTYKVVWSPDGKRIASGSGDQTVQVWNAINGSNVLVYQGHSAAVIAIAWSPDGKRIASGAGETVQVWNTDDGSNVFTYRGHTNKVQWVAWSPNGQSIASGSRDKTVQVWNATTGDTIFTYRGHTENVETVEWSPDGRQLASGALDRTVQVWHVG